MVVYEGRPHRGFDCDAEGAEGQEAVRRFLLIVAKAVGIVVGGYLVLVATFWWVNWVLALLTL